MAPSHATTDRHSRVKSLTRTLLLVHLVHTSAFFSFSTWLQIFFPENNTGAGALSSTNPDTATCKNTNAATYRNTNAYTQKHQCRDYKNTNAYRCPAWTREAIC